MNEEIFGEESLKQLADSINPEECYMRLPLVNRRCGKPANGDYLTTVVGGKEISIPICDECSGRILQQIKEG